MRNPFAAVPPAPLADSDAEHIATIVQQVYDTATIESLGGRIVITTNTAAQRDLIVRRLRALGYVARRSDNFFAVIVGWDPSHPSVRALSPQELDARIAHLQALRTQTTTATADHQ